MPSLESILALSRSWSLELEALWKALVLGGRGGGLGGGGTGGGVPLVPSSDLKIQAKKHLQVVLYIMIIFASSVYTHLAYS